MNKHLPFIYLSINDVCVAAGDIGNSTLYTYINKGEFPPPEKLGSRSLWRSDVVAAWLENKSAQAAAERDERTQVARVAAQRMVDARVRRQTQAMRGAAINKIGAGSQENDRRGQG